MSDACHAATSQSQGRERCRCRGCGDHNVLGDSPSGAKGVRYASCKVANSTVADGATFVILLELDDGAENPLAAVPAFREFQQGLANWLAEPPIPEQLTVVGSYNLF